MKRILLLVNDITTVLQFRCELIRAFVEEGNEVIVSVPKNDRICEIEELGATVIETEVSRHGKNPFKDLKLRRNYKKLIKEIQPDIVLTFTVKPNIYGGMACKSLGVPYVANVTGLGVVGKKGILQKLMLTLYKKGLKNAQCIFFQNQANREFFKIKKVVCKNDNLLPGSGVNIEKFKYIEYPTEETTNIVFVGRIIEDKGVYELAQVAKTLSDRKDIKFTVVGDVEYGSENPFDKLSNVECVGYHKNIIPFIEKANAIILPSYHEGMANVLLEGAACGRPILASNIAGCKETFDEGISGFGFEKQNIDSLLEVVTRFCELDNEQKRQMGIRGREKIETQFDRKIVIQKYLEQINKDK